MKYMYIKTAAFIGFVILICFAAVKNARLEGARTVFLSETDKTPTIILDAGHGGEDGGALAPDGTAEKDINLSVTLKTAALFEVFGIKYIPVRTEDVSVGDNSLSTMRERKRSDIKNRENLVNNTENSIFFSIHQNKFDIAKYSGTQVFYGSLNGESEILAQCIQDSVKSRLQPQNTRQIKPSGDSIYLLYHAKVPAVMTECGFLSNPEELSLLKSDEYQKKMAYSIFSGLLNYLNNCKG